MRIYVEGLEGFKGLGFKGLKRFKGASHDLEPRSFIKQSSPENPPSSGAPS